MPDARRRSALRQQPASASMAREVQPADTTPTALRRRRQRRSGSVGALVGLAALVVVALTAGCGEDEAATAARDTCQSVVQEAARESELRRQVELLDNAIAICSGVAALDVELQRHRGLVGFDTDTFVAGRCARTSSAATQSSPICATALAPVEAAAEAEDTVETYVGQTLDGRTVEITDEQVPFAEGKPQPIVQLVDIAAEDGCDALLQERARWQTLVVDPLVGDQASVYAQHADNVAAFIGCTSPPTTDDD
jgi:hypothetical protein